MRNIQTTIDILRRNSWDIHAFDLRDYQFNGRCYTEEELHRCGSSACVAGYIGISREWRALGGEIDEFGGPTHNGLCGDDSLYFWFGADHILDQEWVNGLCYLSCNGSFYGKDAKDVTIDDAIAKLEDKLFDGGHE